ncbi:MULTISPECIES: cytochrome b [unclassified Vibrio]|uniref:cytochrome b n=1 Tax=unclassified Vibrio TaxID=2614977 RepID=UPI001361A44F|nr:MULTISPECIES: cytochrome b [unclassified Vibrio]NAW60049.1 cytochrome b [Vibrio sp. V36_P2S2PM302]NAX26774.1 cytochrome b [Vibrio sp. V38_P2S17PM301]NAX32484.1 cytochrome b [Vibrio sp. V37_P2S8PM304]
MSDSRSLSWQTVSLHWLTAIAFLTVFSIGLYMSELPRGPEKGEWVALHKSLGATVLLLALFRLGWRIKEGRIKPLSTLPAWQEKLAHLIHVVLILVTLMMPLSGIIMSRAGGRAIEVFGWEVIAAGEKQPWLQEAGSAVHHATVNIIVIALVLHVAGALKHHYIDKDATMRRIVGK